MEEPKIKCLLCDIICTSSEAYLHTLETGHDKWELIADYEEDNKKEEIRWQKQNQVRLSSLVNKSR